MEKHDKIFGGFKESKNRFNIMTDKELIKFYRRIYSSVHTVLDS